MEVLLIVFMIFAACIGIFSVVVVIYDLVESKKNAAQPEAEPAPPEAPYVEEPVAPSTAGEEMAMTVIDENAVVFSPSEAKTLDEKFMELPPELQRYYIEIVQYAFMQEGAKQYRNANYEEYKIGKTRLVRMQIKRGVVVCEFILLNPDFRNYIQDNKVRVRQAPTVLRVEDEAAVAIAKSSIDIAVKAAADEIEYKKQRRREKRRLSRQQ